jgi:hypothetical protein
LVSAAEFRRVTLKVIITTMAVHFMFAASKQFDSVPVAGDSIPLGRLKDEIYNLKFRAALEKQRIKEAFDFRVYNAETKEEILGAHTRVPKHSRVLVKRVPAFVVSQQLATRSCKAQEIHKPCKPLERVVDDDFGDDVYSSSSESCVSSERNPNGNSMTSNLPATKAPEEVQRIDVVSANTKAVGPRAAKGSRVVRAVKNLDVNSENVAKSSLESRQMVQIPLELACSLCHDIMKDPVLIPCCCNSFCRNCVTVAILEQQKCPKCGSSKCRDSDLLPNRHMNNMIQSFLKSNGIPLNDVTASSNGSNSFSSQSPASSISSEHNGDTSEFEKASDYKSSVDPPFSNTNLSGSQKRKSAPLSISLTGAKKAKPLSISLTGAKEARVLSF